MKVGLIMKNETKNVKDIKKIFMKETVDDSFNYYKSLLNEENTDFWDWIVLTASNDQQAKSYEEEINYRIKNKLIPKNTKYLVVADPDGKKVGSGGATLNVIKKVSELDKRPFDKLKILIIHSGGDSKRVPQYSACGKIFSPVQKELFYKKSSSLFDEFLIRFASIPKRMSPGILLLSGDVLLVFNPSQVELHHVYSAAISIKEKVETGCNHGVFLSNNDGLMKEFLHKQSIDVLRKKGATNDMDYVDIDTGSIYFNSKIVNILLSLVNTTDNFKKFVNEKCKISLYVDFLYPLATDTTLEDYLKQTPEGDFCDELIECRKLIWKSLNEYNLKIIKTSPSRFIHFGTTNELVNSIIKKINEYKFLGWKRHVMSNVSTRTDFCTNCSIINGNYIINRNCYIENSIINNNVEIGENSVISNTTLEDVIIPKNVCLSTLKLTNNMYVTRIYSIFDNPKIEKEKDFCFLNTNLISMQKKYNISDSLIWDSNKNLWEAKLYVPSKNEQESVLNALKLYDIVHCKAKYDDALNYFKNKRISLFESSVNCDNLSLIKRKDEIENKVRKQLYIKALENKCPILDANEIILNSPNVKLQITDLFNSIDDYDFSIKSRIYLSLSLIPDIDKKLNYNKKQLEDLCFEEIKKFIYDEKKIANKKYKTKDKYTLELPIRVNFGGGWSDTPPYCIENGGNVLNAAFKLNNELPIKVEIEKISDKHIILQSKDLNSSGIFTDINELKNCNDTNDPYSLLKASLIITGIVLNEDKSIDDVIKRIGGGLKFTTTVANIPKGSGLGTSSILAGACIKTIYGFLNINVDDDYICQKVLEQEQIMGTGGGWQDQIGGIIPGIKYIKTNRGKQIFEIEKIKLSKKMINEFNNRFVLIYTGQRRLAKNLLRGIMSKYISNDKSAINIIGQIQTVAKKMKEALINDDFKQFGRLLNKHFALLKKLDSGCTNVCIDQIINSCSDLIEANMICGAGGGGFLQVILKENVSKENLKKRIGEVFQDCGVKVYDVSLYLGDDFL